MKTKVTHQLTGRGEFLYHVYKWGKHYQNEDNWQLVATATEEEIAKLIAQQLADGTHEKTIAEYGES